jgi:hypothetical protein
MREKTIDELIKKSLEINSLIITDAGFESPKRSVSLLDSPTVSNFLQNKLGLSNDERLLFAFPCSQLVNGTLYLFNSYLCFDPSTGEEPTIYYLGDISKLQKNGSTTIILNLKIGESLKFYRFEERDKSLELINNQITKELPNEDEYRKKQIEKIGTKEPLESKHSPIY